MGSQLGDLKKFVSDIRKKIDSICHEKCKDLNLDEKSIFGNSEKIKEEYDEVGESSSSEKRKSSSVPPSIEPEIKNSTSSKSDDTEKTDEEIKIDINDEIKRINSKIDSEKSRYADSNPNNDEMSTNSDNGKDDNSSFRYEYSDNTVDPSLEPNIIFGDGNRNKNKKNNSSIGGGLKRFGLKRLSNYALKKGYKTAAKKGLAKAGTKVGGKVAAKQLGKVGAKSLSKKLPFGLGLIPAAAFAIDRATDGDFSGAGLELASGATAAVPIVGTLGSVGLDAYLADRDVKKDTGTGIVGHGMNKANELAGKYVENRIKNAITGESFECFNTLYERAKIIFESETGINESVDGYCFDDYVMESKIENMDVSNKITDETDVFFGYRNVCESFGSDEDELKRLFKKISPDGKISIEDLAEKSTDMPDIIATKKRILQLLGNRKKIGGAPSFDFNAKEYKKAYDMSMDQSGKPTNYQLLHRGLDQLGSGVSSGLERNFLIPQEISKKLNIPKNLGRLAGAGIGGLLFGPVGALAGTALANWLVNNHENYKAKQYAKYHGLNEKNAKGNRSGYIGGLAGAGIGTLLGGPVGGIVGAGIGHLLDRKKEANIENNR